MVKFALYIRGLYTHVIEGCRFVPEKHVRKQTIRHRWYLWPDLNTVETRVWRLDSRPNLQPCWTGWSIRWSVMMYSVFLFQECWKAFLQVRDWDATRIPKEIWSHNQKLPGASIATWYMNVKWFLHIIFVTCYQVCKDLFVSSPSPTGGTVFSLHKNTSLQVPKYPAIVPSIIGCVLTLATFVLFFRVHRASGASPPADADAEENATSPKVMKVHSSSKVPSVGWIMDSDDFSAGFFFMNLKLTAIAPQKMMVGRLINIFFGCYLFDCDSSWLIYIYKISSTVCPPKTNMANWKITCF